MLTVPIRFFLPASLPAFKRLPQSLPDYCAWQSEETELLPYSGRYHWVLQTYLHLREAGLAVELVREMPTEGIVFAHIEYLEYGFRPSSSLLLVPLLVDKDLPLPYAQVHITHNPVQKLPLGLSHRYMPPWPQIGLIPRDEGRGSRFDTISFLGYSENLYPHLASFEFAARLDGLGLRLQIVEPSRWHDFSTSDAVLAVRNFGYQEKHLTKPALKLFNAWSAGVPALIGFETACRAAGCPGVDYLEVCSADEVVAALGQLSVDADFRSEIVAAGAKKLATLQVTRLRSLWIELIEQELVPRYESWRDGPWSRARFNLAGEIRERLLWRNPGWYVEYQAVPSCR